MTQEDITDCLRAGRKGLRTTARREETYRRIGITRWKKVFFATDVNGISVRLHGELLASPFYGVVCTAVGSRFVLEKSKNVGTVVLLWLGASEARRVFSIEELIKAAE